MADDAFLTTLGADRPVHRWHPPEHPDVTLYTPTQVPAGERGDVRTLERKMPVWVYVEYAEIGSLHTHGFAAAASDTCVLVETTWQGRLQAVWARREVVTHRKLRERR